MNTNKDTETGDNQRRSSREVCAETCSETEMGQTVTQGDDRITMVTAGQTEQNHAEETEMEATENCKTDYHGARRGEDTAVTGLTYSIALHSLLICTCSGYCSDCVMTLLCVTLLFKWCVLCLRVKCEAGDSIS